MCLSVFDLTPFQVITDGKAYLRATVRNLDPTFGVTDGAQLLDVYVHVPGARRRLPWPRSPPATWSQRLEVQGFAAPVLVDASGDPVGPRSSWPTRATEPSPSRCLRTSSAHRRLRGDSA